MKAIGTQCAERVFSGERWDTRGHGCGKPAKVHVNGKDWCATHDPAKVSARKAVEEAGREIGDRMLDAKADVRELERLVLAAVRGGGDVTPLRDRLADADAALAKIEAEARAHGKVSPFYWGR
jgi:hypothetical protein